MDLIINKILIGLVNMLHLAAVVYFIPLLIKADVKTKEAQEAYNVQCIIFALIASSYYYLVIK